MLTLAEVAEATGGRVLGDENTSIDSVSTDSRSIDAGALFVALEGPTFDGHTFLDAAHTSGSPAALIHREEAWSGEGRPSAAVLVENTLKGLQDLAAWHRRRLSPAVVGLTGSAGKTTTKELTASILDVEGETLATLGNLNNHIGVPLTLLRLREHHRFAVIEMGCNDFGEIGMLAGLAAPESGLITNVGAAHLEKLGDLDGVARAKGELFASLPESGTAVVNLDDPRIPAIPCSTENRLTFGRGPEAEIRLLDRRALVDGTQQIEIELGSQGTIAPKLKLLGEHNALNALAAAALATTVGAGPESIEAGLEKAEGAPGRLRGRAGVNGTFVIDDSYNANPNAMRAALDLSIERRQEGGAVYALLGEMLELGSEGPAAHEAVGRYAAERGLTSLVGIGAVGELYARGARAVGLDEVAVAETPEQAAELLVPRLAPGDVILVKGSRGARTERAFEVLCAPPERVGDG